MVDFNAFSIAVAVDSIVTNISRNTFASLFANKRTLEGKSFYILFELIYT